MKSVGLDVAKQAVCLSFEGKWPDISESLVLNNSVALDAMHSHSTSIVNLSERAKSLVVSWSNHVHLVAVPD